MGSAVEEAEGQVGARKGTATVSWVGLEQRGGERGRGQREPVCVLWLKAAEAPAW